MVGATLVVALALKSAPMGVQGAQPPAGVWGVPNYALSSGRAGGEKALIY